MGGGGRSRRLKTFKKALFFYQKSFGFHEPYLVLIENSFLDAALSQRLNIYEAIQKILNGASFRLMSTECLRHHMKCDDKNDCLNRFVVSKKYETIKLCNHNPAIEVNDCILSIVAKAKDNIRFMVASNSDSLKEELRKIPGIPIIFNHRGQVFLEAPSKLSCQVALREERSKLRPDGDELKILAKVIPAVPAISYDQKLKKKRKRSVAPNPLSCKKKKMVKAPKLESDTKKPQNSQPIAEPNPAVKSSAKKHRKRRPRSKKPATEQTAASNAPS